MWVVAIVVIGKLILMRKDKCFMALPINIKDLRKNLKIPSDLRAFLRAILRASQCNLLIFNKYFARKNMNNCERVLNRKKS